MKYFVQYSDSIRGCYHEFYKGKWDEVTFWKKDSIFLHDNIMTDGFVEAIIEVIPTYDPFGETEISVSEWQEIWKRVLEKDTVSQKQYKEANDWLEGVFQKHKCFTILGI